MTIKINGIELKIDERDAQIVSTELARVNAKADEASGKIAELQAAAGAAAVALAAEKARADAASVRVAKIDRAELESTAKVALGGEFKFDGKSDAEVRAAVVAKMLPAVRCDGADAAFVQGAYAAAVELARKAAADLVEAAKQSGAQGTRTDAHDGDTARAEMIKAARERASK